MAGQLNIIDKSRDNLFVIQGFELNDMDIDIVAMFIKDFLYDPYQDKLFSILELNRILPILKESVLIETSEENCQLLRKVIDLVEIALSENKEIGFIAD